MGRRLHVDCFSGVSGDMVLGALVDVGLPLARLRTELKRLKVTGYRLEQRQVHRGALHGCDPKGIRSSAHAFPHSADSCRQHIAGGCERAE